jgi:hypothetical protein
VLLVSPLEGNPFNPLGRGDDLLNLESEALLVRSDAVAGTVIDRLDLATTPARLLEDVVVEVPANTQLLRITAVGTSAGRAHDLADAVAAAFLDYRAGRTLAARAEQETTLHEQLRARSLDRDRLLGELADLPLSSPLATLLGQRVADLTTQVGVLRARLTELELGSTDPGQVVTPALADPPGLLARRPLVATAGALAGAALALALLLGVRRWWPRRGGGALLVGTAPRVPSAVRRPRWGASVLSLRATVARRLTGGAGTTT